MSSPTATKMTKKGTEEVITLPSNYAPTEWDVICQRGKECFQHVGNQRFRECVDEHLETYISAPTRQDKTVIVVSISHAIQEKAVLVGGRGFVRYDQSAGRWQAVTDKMACVKVGQALRDAVKLARKEHRMTDLFETVKRQQQERLQNMDSKELKRRRRRRKSSQAASTAASPAATALAHSSDDDEDGKAPSPSPTKKQRKDAAQYGDVGSASTPALDSYVPSKFGAFDPASPPTPYNVADLSFAQQQHDNASIATNSVQSQPCFGYNPEEFEPVPLDGASPSRQQAGDLQAPAIQNALPASFQVPQIPSAMPHMVATNTVARTDGIEANDLVLATKILLKQLAAEETQSIAGVQTTSVAATAWKQQQYQQQDAPTYLMKHEAAPSLSVPPFPSFELYAREQPHQRQHQQQHHQQQHHQQQLQPQEREQGLGQDQQTTAPFIFSTPGSKFTNVQDGFEVPAPASFGSTSRTVTNIYANIPPNDRKPQARIDDIGRPQHLESSMTGVSGIGSIRDNEADMQATDRQNVDGLAPRTKAEDGTDDKWAQV